MAEPEVSVPMVIDPEEATSTAALTSVALAVSVAATAAEESSTQTPVEVAGASSVHCVHYVSHYQMPQTATFDIS